MVTDSSTPEPTPEPTPGVGAAPVQPRTNTLSIVALALAIGGWFGGLSVVPGIILGHVALVQIKRHAERGRGLAIASLVVGYVGLALAIVTLIAIVTAGVWGILNDPSFQDGHRLMDYM